MPVDEAVSLAGMLCSRLCHDLIGPSGALANGLDICEDPAMVEAALGLMRSTSGELNARLAFYRRAYGTGTGLTWDEAHELTDRYLGGGRYTLAWRKEDHGDDGDDAALVRLVMNMTLCGVDAVPGGGELSVVCGASPTLTVTGEGEVSEEVLRALAGNSAHDLANPTPRDIQPGWTAMLADHAGGTLIADQENDGAFRLSFVRRDA